jgi:hypothetical protein
LTTLAPLAADGHANGGEQQKKDVHRGGEKGKEREIEGRRE